MSYRAQLRELAFESHGIVTVADAAAIGVPAVEVRKLAGRGALTRLGHGVYRMNEAPQTHLTEFAAAVAMTGSNAVLADEGVLAALDLAPVNLRRIPVATDRRVRRNLPATVDLRYRRFDPSTVSDVDGVPAMSVATAILASRGTIPKSRLIDAARNASALGLLDAREADRLTQSLEQQ